MDRRLNGGGAPADGTDSIAAGPAAGNVNALGPGDPRQVGSYILLERLGQGALGPVYLGRSPGGRSVAVKVVHPGLAGDPGFRLRFAREVETASRAGAAFTVPVIDADPDAPLPWLVTGYVPGPSLAEVVGRHGPLPVPAVLVLAAGLATGLRAIHAAGVVHGDLEPTSVLLAQDGPRLAGFGFWQAKAYARLVTGLAPEAGGFAPSGQAPGQSAGPAGDIYALGAVLAFAATGQSPSWALHPGAGAGSLPEELRQLIGWCLAGDPAARPTADQFLAGLAAAHPQVSGQADWLASGILPGSAPAAPEAPAGPADPAVTGRKRRMSRRRRTLLTATAAVVAAAAVAAGLLAAWPRPRLEPPTGLTVVKESPWSITLGWKANAGLRPAGYEIVENGSRVATVPAGQTSYLVTGLTVKTHYQFTVVAVGGNSRSVPSATLLADTPAAPPFSAAAFAWTGYVTYKETFSSDTYFKKLGSTWQDDWNVNSDCGWQACATATLTGAVDGQDFTAHLARSGATYQGSAPIDDYWLDCEHQNDYEKTTLHIKLTVTGAGAVLQQHWMVTRFSGAVTWDVPALPDGCSSSLYKMNVTGPLQVAGVSP